MSSEHTYHSNWSIDDIHRYINVQMTPNELSRFEHDMATDPFFKDAVDGYAGHARIHVDHHLQRLNDQFTNKSNRNIAVPMWAYGAAASLILLATVWFLFGPQLLEKGLTYMADNRNPEKQSIQKANQEETTFDVLENESMDAQDQNIDMLEEDSTVILAMSDESEAAPTATGVRTNRTQSAVARTRRRAQKKKIGGIISGAVVDQNGEPLIGANIYFPSNQAGITSDFNGKFAVELKGYDSVAIVNYTGFTTGVFSIKGDQSNKFQLAPDETKLAEVAVSTTPASEESDNQAMDAVMNEEDIGRVQTSNVENSNAQTQLKSAQPEKGYKKYERYIRRNLEYPTVARASRIEGIVKLQFKVLANGEIFDVRVIKSLGGGCDEEAIRLIKEGPSWASADQTATRQGQYEIEFSLK